MLFIDATHKKNDETIEILSIGVKIFVAKKAIFLKSVNDMQ